MTIGIGMICRDGVLLGADTEVTGWSSKTHEEKIITFECPYGKIGFVMAGNGVFAQSAIQKCQAGLRATPPERTIDKIEKILEREYRRHVFQHPSYATDPSLGYQFLIAFWSTNGSVSLFSTNQTAIRKVNGFECIGIGSDLASYLVLPMFYEGMADAEALYIAIYALARVKDSIVGCGGTSIFTNIRARDGNIGTLTTNHEGPCKEIEEYARAFDSTVHRLLLWMAATNMEEHDFVANVTEDFNQEILGIRSRWKASYEMRVRKLAEANPTFAPERIREIAHKLATRGWID
ncbi:MAG TPA: hypothetical protein VGL97_17720 [Bryobacteraceae bacterium]|jgi:20S proteasome alpha/beta subunit